MYKFGAEPCIIVFSAGHMNMMGGKYLWFKSHFNRFIMEQYNKKFIIMLNFNVNLSVSYYIFLRNKYK